MNTKIEEAKRLIAGIVSHQKNTDDRLRNFEDQVKDLKHAQKLLAEGQTKTYEPEVHNNDFALKQYKNEDGSVQWNTATVSKNIAGQGRVNVEQKGLLDAEVYANQWHADLCKMNQDRSLARMMMKDPYTPKADMKLYSHLQKAPSFMKNAVGCVLCFLLYKWNVKHFLSQNSLEVEDLISKVLLLMILLSIKQAPLKQHRRQLEQKV
jgi:hypothetical protein